MKRITVFAAAVLAALLFKAPTAAAQAGCGAYPVMNESWSHVHLLYHYTWSWMSWTVPFWEEHVRREFQFIDERRVRQSWSGLGTTEPNLTNFSCPWARHVNTLAFLQGASPTQPTSIGDRYPSRTEFVTWGYRYIQQEVARFKAGASRDANASTSAVANTVTLYTGYFGREDTQPEAITARAAILIHEARHAEGCLHNGNDRGGRCSAGSCDESWRDGCWGLNDRPGANRYAAEWMLSLLRSGHSGLAVSSNEFLRQRGVRYVNYRIDCRFDDYPGFRVGETGTWSVSGPVSQCDD